MPKVFISYSHDSDKHRRHILALSDQLREDGIDCDIDQYINGAPPVGWPRWMESRIEQADYVLIVCTETYLKRFKGEDNEGGRGVNFEGVIITQELYDNFQHNTKFLPVIPDDGDINHVPLMLKGESTHRIGKDYENIYRVLTDQPRATAKPLGKIKQYPSQQAQRTATKTIHIDRLPTVAGDFFGREVELEMLDDALANNETRVLQFIAAGGTGKTKLLRHWLNQHLDTIPNYLIWSFYSQGTSDSKQVSASPLIIEAFKAFAVDPEQYHTDEDRADALAELLIENACLLVLDGLEPMQHGGKGFIHGQLKDRGMKRLLQTLAQRHSSLCVITSRLSVHDLKDRPHVVKHPLDNLETNDGVDLLRSWGVTGREKELQDAVAEVEGHALTLHLLGNAITTYLDNDIRKRDTLGELIDDYGEQGRHAFKVMQGYQRWLTDEKGQPSAELQCLYLLGLFDHPVEEAVLQVLWAKAIPGLTADIPEKAWKVAICQLRDRHRLLSAYGERPDLLDCHPLIREYFGKQLERQQSEAWHQAHKTLYDYYKGVPDKEQPDSVEEMQPLFHAVAHGCAAGLHQQVLDEVYWPRINRKNEHYLAKKLGAFSDDLAVVAHFFSQPWRVPAAGLTEAYKAVVLNWAGFRLRALGRLDEAVEPMDAGTELQANQEDWKNAAIGTSNLSELQLTLGRVAAAVETGERSVAYADQSGDLFYRMSTRTAHADALHQAGQPEAALAVFAAAEQLQLERQPEYPRLYSLQGFQYCDLLLAQGRVGAVLERAEQTLEWAKEHLVLLDIALDQLSLGRAHDAQGDRPQALETARDWLDQAVAGLRKAGQEQYLPLGLLFSAALRRDLGDYNHVQRDLDEVREIAEAGEMKLHLTDYHLEMARLLLAQKKPYQAINHHLQAATALVEDTGYHRRDPELAELQDSLMTLEGPMDA